VLLAAAKLWKSAVRQGYADVPLIVESAQVFDTHHVAMLLAAGASAVVPYLAEEFAEAEEPGAFKKVRSGMYNGLRKVLARMGISTLASYRNSHLFEVLGLEEQICHEFFEDAGRYPGTKSLINVLQDYLKMHASAYSNGAEAFPTLASTVSAKARSCMPTRPNLSAASTRTRGSRSQSTIPLSRNWARLRAHIPTRFTGNVARAACPSR